MRKNGYTLVEMMIVLVVLVVLSGMIYIVISQGKDAAESVDVRAQLTEGARTAMRELVRDLCETSSDTVTTVGAAIPSFVDPINGETHQILIFASARGDPADAAEDGTHANNDYVHLDADYKPVWRSVIVYCTYVTPENIQQLRKYIIYNNVFAQAGMFPFSVVSVTATAITLQRGDGASLVIPRNSGSARANYIASEDSNHSGTLEGNENDGNDNLPADNEDGILDTGADFTLSGSLVEIKLFLSKRELPTKGGTRRLTVTLSNSMFMRN